jgi:hypothetical protein
MSTAVVYLARQADGLDATRSFVRSYHACEARFPHELLVVLKGFDRGRARAEAVDAFGAAASRFVDVDDRGFDLGPYFTVARSLDHQAYLFLNTFSRILEAGWLAKFAAALAAPRVGLAGATASYESHWTAFQAEDRWWKVWPRASRRRALYRRRFDPFPNPHIRTNAFMIARDTLLRLDLPPVVEKEDAWAIESGRDGLTRQVQRLGLDAVVVDRTGKWWTQDEWPASRTFRSGNEDNLLIADNQTDVFLKADPQRRAILSRLAWGA